MKQISRVKNFYKKTWQERLDFVKKFANLSNDEEALLKHVRSVDGYAYDPSIENVISGIVIPIGIATNFIVNNREYLVPMATEEPSVVAGACNAAKLAREAGGFSVKCDDPVMIGQILIVDVIDTQKAVFDCLKNKEKILKLANLQDPFLFSIGGGACDFQVKELTTTRGLFLVLHLFVNVKDAMGANIVNSMLETIAPLISKITAGIARAKIVSNLATSRLVTAKAVWLKKDITSNMIESILDLYAFACADPYRAATHNKGIMNGIDAVALATGNDFRAVEAAAHGFAALNRPYGPLTHYEVDRFGNLVGTLQMPLAIGIVGGTTKSNSIASLCLKIIGATSSLELASIMVSVGLAQNFAALRVLAGQGIQKGHMSLHARNVAINAGVSHSLVDKVAKKMILEGCISFDRAKELLCELELK